MNKLLVFLVFTAFICFNVNSIKITENLKFELDIVGTSDVRIVMKEFMDFENHKHNGRLLSTYTSDERAEIIMNTLMSIQKRTQSSIQSYLSSTLNIRDFQSYWIDNTIIIKDMDKSKVLSLDSKFHKDVEVIEKYEAPTLPKHEDEQFANIRVVNATTTANQKSPEPNLSWVKAPQVWAKGAKGKGITVGVLDTGIVHTHPALVNSYAGNLGGGRFNHDYNWRGRTRTPTDAHGHGTHCSGTVAGGVARQIGVAPEAKLTHCHGLVRGVPLSSCLQWFLAPTKVDGSGRDPSKRPHVTSHSWQGGSSHCRAFTSLLNAGVHVVLAAGNSGSRCSSVHASTNCRDIIIVAALNRNSNTAARFSSRGPGTSSVLTPSHSAPGVSVVSSLNRGGYGPMSGTSMACPNVAGGVALLWSAFSGLRRNIRETNRILSESALKQTTTECTRNGGSPNFVYGHGTVDYLKAYNLAARKYKVNDNFDYSKFIDSLENQ